MAKSPEQVLEKYRRRVQSAGPDYKAGVQSPARSWQDGYLRSVNRMVTGFQEAVAQNRPQTAVRNLGDSGWQSKTLEKSDRYAQSADRAAQNFAAVVSKVLQAGEAGRQAANQIPGDTLEQRYERVRANGNAIRRMWGKD